MSEWKGAAAAALGYLAFATLFFFLSLYLTFDPNVFAPAIIQGLQSQEFFQGKKIAVEEIRRHGLAGLDFRSISVSPSGAGPDQPGPDLTADRLAVSLRLRSLPGLVRSIRGGKAPALSLSSYTLNMAGGVIKGRLENGPKVFVFEAAIKEPIIIDRLRFPSERLKDARLGGKLSGEIVLRAADKNDPGSLKGEIKINLDKPSLANLTMAGLDELVMDNGALIAQLDGPLITIQTLELQGEDLPVTLQGSIRLNEPFRASIVDVKGSIMPGQSFKNKNPITAAIMPDSKNFAYSGPLDALLPGMF